VQWFIYVTQLFGSVRLALGKLRIPQGKMAFSFIDVAEPGSLRRFFEAKDSLR
jgi:hypothetical protein